MKKKDFFKSIPLRDTRRGVTTFALALAVSGMLSAQNWIDVTDTYIVNADFSTGTNEGWESGTVLPAVNATFQNAELYQSQNSASQKVMGLKAGKYKLAVQGFYRAGGNDNGAGYEAGTEVIQAYLFAGTDSVKMKSLYSEAKDVNVVNQRNGWPDGMEGMHAYCEKYPESYWNELTFTVEEGEEMLMGVAIKTNAGGTWTCWDNFKLYIEGTAFDAFAVKLSKLEFLQDSLQVLGITAAQELSPIIDGYKEYNASTPENEIAQASVIIDEYTALVQTLCVHGATLRSSIAKAQDMYDKMESGVYQVADAVKADLKNGIEAARGILQLSTLNEVKGAVEQGIADMEAATVKATTFISLAYSLQKAKDLADRIGGLEGNEAYAQVKTLLSGKEEMTYDVAAAATSSLNAACLPAMTGEFLEGASDENPIELTSFITNPNIYQKASEMTPPDGWKCQKGSADGTWYTTPDGTGNKGLICNSWTGNRLTGSNYGQLIGGDSDGAVKLPDGLYTLKAATWTNTTPSSVHLYASTDSVDFAFAEVNDDKVLYDEACETFGTTTEVSSFEVRDGKLYIGVVCDGPVTGNGKEWDADNFRLYYIKKDVISAYRDRLQVRLDSATSKHEKLLQYGIDDSDEIGFALDPTDGYLPIIETGTVEELMQGIQDMDRMNAEADSIIKNYETISPLLSEGAALDVQMKDGLVWAQPKAAAEFSVALEDAMLYAEDMSWDNYLDERIKTKVENLNGCMRTLKASIALCYPMAKAKTLADQIGGLSDNEAYKAVVELLKNDDFDQIDADMNTEALKMACVEAMTPEVLAGVSVDNPLDMTSFIVNPNIYQDATDENGSPINTLVNGWECTSTADSPARTDQLSGDTWLSCWSWSGNAAHNIGTPNIYSQVLGNMGNQEGKVALPDGAYRVEAATYCTRQPELIQLFALTRQIDIETVENSVGEDSTVYVYSDSVFTDAPFNGDLDKWDIAQGALSTTTVIPEVYVENGTVVIGVRGTGVVGGNGQYWWADNFRLYYVGQNKGDNIHGISNGNPDGKDKVDVFDLAGRMIRQNVERADALKGLRKGIYIVDGKKYIVR
ncbi:hypothetical protein [Paraprevotella xylaniphila]|jgi:hypothetical protein